MATLRLEIQGRPGEITLDAFLSAARNAKKILADLDSAISHEPRGSLEWVVTDLATGSLKITLASQARLDEDDTDVGPQVIRSFIEGWLIIESEGRTPPLFSETAMRSARRLVSLIGHDGTTGLIVSDSEGKAVISAKAEANIGQLLTLRRRSIGSIEGTLETISVHGKPKIIVYHARTRKAITCILPPTLSLADVAGALSTSPKRVSVSGAIRSNARGEPMRIEVEHVRVFRDESDLPSIKEIGGSDPKFTGDMTAEEYIQSIRVG